MIDQLTHIELAEGHPSDHLLRQDRLPHIWCSGCGLGTVLTAFVSALRKTDLDPSKVAVVSGIGCTGRAAGYLNVDGFHTTHGRAIPFATGLKLANPELTVVVISGDGDLIAIGGNHLIHSARRNMDIKVICVNNLNYGMTSGQVGPTTPVDAKTTTTPYGNAEYPFNLPHLVAACGATYVARWTALHVRRMERSFMEVLTRRGFSLVEVISSCPTYYGRFNKLGAALDQMKFYHGHSTIEHGADTATVGMGDGDSIIVGEFVNTKKPTFGDLVKRSV